MATATVGRRVLVPWDQEPDYNLPDGLKAAFKIVDADIGESQKGDQQIVLTFLVLAPPKHKGKKIKQWYTFPSGLPMLRQCVQVLLGKQMPKSAAALDLDSLIGKVCVAEVQITERQGRKFQNLINYERPKAAQEDGDEEEASDEEDDEDA